MFAMGPVLTKVGAIERQLEAAVLLVLRDQFPEAAHTLIFASRGLLYGIHSANPIPFLSFWEEKIRSRVMPGREKEWRFYENRVANFFKHADKDPNGIINNVDLVKLNELELLICILGYWQLSRKVSNAHLLGLIYCGIQTDSIFDIAGIFDDLGLPTSQIKSFKLMQMSEVRKTMLEAFDLSYPNKCD